MRPADEVPLLTYRKAYEYLKDREGHRRINGIWTMAHECNAWELWYYSVPVCTIEADGSYNLPVVLDTASLRMAVDSLSMLVLGRRISGESYEVVPHVRDDVRGAGPQA